MAVPETVERARVYDFALLRRQPNEYMDRVPNLVGLLRHLGPPRGPNQCVHSAYSPRSTIPKIYRRSAEWQHQKNASTDPAGQFWPSGTPHLGFLDRQLPSERFLPLLKRGAIVVLPFVLPHLNDTFTQDHLEQFALQLFL